MDSTQSVSMMRLQIQDRGWGVVSQPPTPLGLSYIYSVGLSLVGCPDVMMFSVDAQVGSLATANLVNYLRQHGSLPIDQRISGIITSADGGDDLDVCLKIIPTAVALSHAKWYREILPNELLEEASLSFVQVVWPDDNNRFPWESSFNPELLGSQPQLFNT